MSQSMPLEQIVADWMADEATGGTPDGLVEGIVATTRGSRPLPRWAALLSERPMSAQSRVVVGTPTRTVAFAAVLFLVAATVAIAVGAWVVLRPQPLGYEWPGLRGDAARNGVAARGPIGRPVVAWEFQARGGIRTSPAVAGDIVLTSSDDGVLHALAIETGAERWSFRGPTPMNGPFAADGLAYVVDGDGIIHALALAGGTPVWQTTTPLKVGSDLAVDGNRLFVGTSDGLLVAIDATTGAELWRKTVSPAAGPVHSPAAADGLVVAATDDLVLTASDPATGATRWLVNLQPGVVGTPVVADGLALVGATGDHAETHLAAYDVVSGAPRWVADENVFSPAVADGIGFSGSDIGIVSARALATGAERWRVSFGVRVRPPAVGGGAVYVSIDGTNEIVALDRATGRELWRFGLGGENPCCLAVGHGMVFAGTSLGTLYAIAGDGAALSPQPRGAETATPRSTPAPSDAARTSPPLRAPNVDWVATTGADDFAPFGLARAPDGRLWAAEGLVDRFAIFNPDGTFAESWGKSGSGDGEFRLSRANGDPYGMVAFAPDGSFFVLDAGNREIDHFAADRHFLGSWGGFGAEPGTFLDPVSVALGADARVYVLDDQRGVIEAFDADGNVIRTIRPAAPGQAPAVVANQLAIGPNGHLYVSAIAPNEVVELDPDGNVIRTYGAPGSVGALSGQPNVVAFDRGGRVFVTQGPDRGEAPGVMIFETNSAFIGGFGPIGAGPDAMGFPWGLVVTDEAIYVADAEGTAVSAHGDVRKFEPPPFR